MPVSVLSYSNKELNCIINTEKMNQKDASINNDEQEDDIPLIGTFSIRQYLYKGHFGLNPILSYFYFYC